MKQLVSDPVFWAAIMTLVAGLAGVLVGGYGKKKDHDLAALKVTVEVLGAEVKDLRTEVRDLRSEIASAERELRLEREKTSAAYSVIVTVKSLYNGLRVRADMAEFPIGEFPEIPALILDDLRHRFDD